MAAVENDTALEDSADLVMHLLPSQRLEERHRDHCDYLLDSLDQQLDQLQSQSNFKTSPRKTEVVIKPASSELNAADMEQSHETDSKEPKDTNPTGSNEQCKDNKCKKEEYKWRLTSLLGSEETDYLEYQSDSNSAESVCTEDFVMKFKQGMVEPIGSISDHEDLGLSSAHYTDGKLKQSLEEEPLRLIIPLTDVTDGDNCPLNTARCEDILQQFKEELEEDLQAAFPSDEGKVSMGGINRADSLESLGGTISRLSQANISEPLSLINLGATSLKANSFSSINEDHCVGPQLPNDTKLYNKTTTFLKETTENKYFENYDVGINIKNTRNSSSEVLGSYAEILDSGWRSGLEDTQIMKYTSTKSVDEKSLDKNHQYQVTNVAVKHKEPLSDTARKHLIVDVAEPPVSDSVQTEDEFASQNTRPKSTLESSCTLILKDQEEDMSNRKSSLKDESYTTSPYKHVAGVPLRSFDTVTVDSDLDSVTTERVRDHIRRVFSSRRDDRQDSGYYTRNVSRNKNDSSRYHCSSKGSTDDEYEEEFEKPFSSPEWRNVSPIRRSPQKVADHSAKNSGDFRCSLDQGQYRRFPATDELSTERIILEESIAKLRREVAVEEERLSQRKAQYREADQSFHDAQQQKKEAYQELESFRDLLEKTQMDVVKMESRVRESQLKADDLRSELAMLEYKRNEYLKEVQELELELDSVKQQCSTAHNSQIASFQYEISSLTSEREHLKSQVRHLESSLSFMERQELERQLGHAKSEIFSEQRAARAKIENLQENLEELQSKLADKMAECADIQEKNSQLKSQLRELEKKKETQLQNQAAEANEQKEALNQQVADLACQAKEQSMRISSLEKIVSEKELDLLRLRDVISSLKAEKEAQALAVETLKEEQTKRLLELQLQHQQDKDKQLSLLKEELQCQKQKEIQQFAENMEQVKTKALQDQAESLKKEMDKVLKTLVLKDKEIGKLKETLKSQKESMKKLVVELKQEARETVHNTLVREQKKWESEKKDALQIQRHTMEEERLRDMQDLRDALERERRTCMGLEKKSADLQNIIQEHEIHNRSLQREKQEALDELRALLKEEKQEEMRKLQQELAQERERDVERLKIRLQQLEEEQHVVRAERNEGIFREREALAQAERAERALAREISAACERMQSAPGRSAFLSPSRSRHGSPSRLSTSQALQMLHEVSEETNQIIHSLQQEVEAQKRTSLHVQREKERELQQQKDQLQSEKDKALDLLKDRLIQEHIEEITNLQRDQLKDSNSAESRSLRQQLREKDNELRAIQRNMAKWKEETATKLARKFEEELNADLEKSLARSKASESHRYAERPGPGVRRLSMDRRENSHLRSVSNPSLNGAAVQHDFGALKILRHLQGRVRELRTDNKLSHGISMDDLTMQRTDMANTYREKRPLICERSISQSQGTMRK